MVKIIKLNIIDRYQLHIVFDDGVEKIIDSSQFIGDDPFTQPLSDPEFFRQVKIYDICFVNWFSQFNFKPKIHRLYLLYLRKLR